MAPNKSLGPHGRGHLLLLRSYAMLPEPVTADRSRTSRWRLHLSLQSFTLSPLSDSDIKEIASKKAMELT